MDLFTGASIVIVLAAVFGYVNVRFLRLPNAIGLMLIAIIATFIFGTSTWVSPGLKTSAIKLIETIDFQHILLDVLLGFLLFAGALHTNLTQLRVYRWPVMVFATIGVFLSTLLTATLVYFIFRWIQIEIPFIQCLLFGALISPTDPIAVMGILRKAGVPKGLEIKVVGESLFNDGVGVVIFLTILNVFNASTGGGGHGEGAHQAGWLGIIQLFGQEVLGGIVLGIALGYLTYRLMKSIDDYEIEVIITLACVMGGYSLARYLHVSAPLAMVVAGLIVGNDTVRRTAMSETTEQYVDKFWELIDVLMNVVLFVLIGIEILVITLKPEYFLATGCAIVIVLLARFLSLILPIQYFKKQLDFAPYTTLIMTWGGLRGGISIALALSLPLEAHRELFLTITYGVVIFSILVQGLSIGPLTGRLLPCTSPEGAGEAAPH